MATPARDLPIQHPTPGTCGQPAAAPEGPVALCATDVSRRLAEASAPSRRGPACRSCGSPGGNEALSPVLGDDTPRDSSSAPVILKDHVAEDLAGLLRPFGADLRLARRLQAAAIREDRWLDHAPGVSPRVLERIRAGAILPRLTMVDRQTSAVDGFVRYAFRGTGPGVFEAVRIPLLHRPEARKFIICVSSQVGCSLGCSFCATGRMGLIRDLATWEIVDQVLRIRAESEHPVGGIVFMGMGEPLLNYDAVMRAARIFSEPCGLAIDGRAITISTVGVVPGIRRFTAERPRFRLVVSLTSADPAQRRALMPAEAQWPATEVVAALRALAATTGRRVTLAWTMIGGLNTDEPAASQLAELVRGLPVKLDLIDVNDPTGHYRPPTAAELSSFRDALRRHVGAPVARRYSGGRDIDAACGLLAGRVDSCRIIATVPNANPSSPVTVVPDSDHTVRSGPK